MPDQLSGGEQQRVAIARALANNPDLLLADEPTGELDQETGNSVIELLINLTRKNKKTMIMVTHDPSVAKKADSVYYLENGTISHRTP